MLEMNSPIENQADSKEHDGAATTSLPGISASPPGALVQLAGWSNFSEVVGPPLRALGFIAVDRGKQTDADRLISTLRADE